MEKENINTKEYWNINYKECGFYQDHSSADWGFTHAFIARALPNYPCKILEVACGLAHNAKFAASLGHSIIATDFSQIAINENMERFRDDKIKYLCMDLEEAAETFRENDVVMGFEIIEHFREPIIPLLKINKSLKKGGMFVFSIPNENGKYAVWSQHYTIFNYANLGELLFKAGFEKVTYFKTDFSKENIMGVAIK